MRRMGLDLRNEKLQRECDVKKYDTTSRVLNSGIRPSVSRNKYGLDNWGLVVSIDWLR